MAKKDRVKLKNLSETERLRLENEAINTETGDVSKRATKKQLRKREKEGTLGEIKDKPITPQVTDTDDGKPNTTFERTTVTDKGSSTIDLSKDVKAVANLDKRKDAMVISSDPAIQGQSKRIWSQLSKEFGDDALTNPEKKNDVLGGIRKIQEELQGKDRAGFLAAKEVAERYENQVGEDVTQLQADEGESGLRNGMSPTNVTAENAINDDLINNRSDEETREKISAANAANDVIVEDKALRAEKDNLLYKMDLSTNPDGSPKQKVLTDGSTVDQRITNQDIDNAQDEIIDSMAVGDPSWKEKVDAYRKSINQAKGSEGEPAIERLGLQEYYPTINQNIAVGSYSRSMLGSGNIYSGGGGMVMPWSIVDARRRAIEKQALNKAKIKDKIIQMSMVNGAIQYQNQFDNMRMDFLEKYGEASNWSYEGLLDGNTAVSRDFMKELQQLQTFGKQTIDMNARVEKLKEIEVGDDKVSLPESTRDAMFFWMNGAGNMEEMYGNRKKFTKYYKELQAYDDLTYKGNLIVEKIQKDKMPLVVSENWDMEDPKVAKSIQEAYMNLGSPNHDEVYSAVVTLVGKDRLEPIVEQYMRQSKFYIGNSREQTKEELMKYVASNLSTEVESKMQSIMHKEGFLGLGWANYGLKKKKDDRLQLMTTVVNDASNPNNKNALQNAMVQAKAEGADVGAAVLAAWNGKVPIAANVDANGNFVDGLISGKIEVTGQKQNVTLGNNSYEYNGKTLTFEEYQNELKNKPANQRTDWDNFVLDSSPTSMIEDMSVSEANVFYTYDENGEQKPITTDVDPKYFDIADTNVKLGFGGTIKRDVPLKDKDGKTMMEYTYILGESDDDGKPKIVKDYAPEGTIPPTPEGTRDMVVKPYMTKKEISVPVKIVNTFNENAKTTIGQMDDMWKGGGTGITGSAEQGSAGLTVEGNVDDEQVDF